MTVSFEFKEDPDYPWFISINDADDALEEIAADILMHSANESETIKSKGFQALLMAISALDRTLFGYNSDSERLEVHYRRYFEVNLKRIYEIIATKEGGRK